MVILPLGCWGRGLLAVDTYDFELKFHSRRFRHAHVTAITEVIWRIWLGGSGLLHLPEPFNSRASLAPKPLARAPLRSTNHVTVIEKPL